MAAEMAEKHKRAFIDKRVFDLISKNRKGK